MKHFHNLSVLKNQRRFFKVLTLAGVSLFMLFAIVMVSCSKSELDKMKEEYDKYQAENADFNSNLPVFCGQPYVAPTNDPQASPFCYKAYYYRCAGKLLTSTEVSTYCNTYNGFRQITPSLPICIYCD